LAGEMMVSARPFIERDMHPTIIVSAYYQALHEGLKILKDISIPIDFNNDTGKTQNYIIKYSDVRNALLCCIGTKFAARW
jgi:T-complex protein 1 subunit gamma